MSKIEIPKSLCDQIKDGEVILFLGAGASVGAEHPKGDWPPLGDKLAIMLIEKFLGPDYQGLPLAQVAELAISETNLYTVQDYIKEIFNPFLPGLLHKKIPTFRWRAIATTNYDLIIERAYATVNNRVQQVAPFKRNEDRVEALLREPTSIPYVKLHGCITETHDTRIPLILTPDQYVTHRKGRDRLFSKIEEWAYEHTFLYVGHRLADPNLRQFLLHVSTLKGRPRSYMVSPGIKEAEKRFWESKKITCIDTIFDEFLSALESQIPLWRRKATSAPPPSSHPIAKTFVYSGKQPTSSLWAFIERDVEYIHDGLLSGELNPKSFYKGYFEDWAPIQANLDVKRRLNDTLLTEVILSSDDEEKPQQQLYVIKGHAGSGKTVLLHRLAWDAGNEFEQICLYLKGTNGSFYSCIEELYLFCQRRIFVFIDGIGKHAVALQNVLAKARQHKVPLTIIGTAQYNEWNRAEDRLDPFLTQNYELRYLSEKEIDELLILLEKHRSLGYLEKLSIKDRRDAFKEKAGRQLLVALHEATLGDPFEDIIYEEYKNISLDLAQSVYLTICFLHRLNVPVRAGFISRVHQVSFHQFKNDLFSPLQGIVFVKDNLSIRDYQYVTRHSYIAQMLFERMFPEQEKRFHEYVRIISQLDVSYNSDHEAFLKLMSGRRLLETFSDRSFIRRMYEVAHTHFPNNGFLLQQEAIFEKRSDDGSLERAFALISQAKRLEPDNRSISHTTAELYLEGAERTDSPLEKKRLLRKSQGIASDLVQVEEQSSYARHTLIKIRLIEIKDILNASPMDRVALDRKLGEMESYLSSAQQNSPKNSYIYEAEFQLRKLLKDRPAAKESLKKAFELSKTNAYLALSLSKVYEFEGEHELARQVLEEIVEAAPNNRDMHYNLAICMLRHSADDDDADRVKIKYHLRSAFIQGDERYEAKFQYARILYIDEEMAAARELFRELREAVVDSRWRSTPRGIIYEQEKAKRYAGVVINKEENHAWIRRDGTGDTMYAPRRAFREISWTKVRAQTRVSFFVAFNYHGPVAIEITEEGKTGFKQPKREL